ncbi:hypothetical protein [Rickettsia endosymbiont of Culicoides newsteadi]|uniref:hypothetical protein n=1 Tax=Rickettsia endosymbiont of Culicoides newsteadi TaxID=1961830 RepID=UPI000B9C60A6|nr:hypothetical protein [Rickettsia endosymbiont of Culicoides newsteadi]OZG31238.1 hypothetical protein RiCNE_13770 [Rickettsia endosymbiont of Culicoides newsteadi]
MNYKDSNHPSELPQEIQKLAERFEIEDLIKNFIEYFQEDYPLKTAKEIQNIATKFQIKHLPNDNLKSSQTPPTTKSHQNKNYNQR